MLLPAVAAYASDVRSNAWFLDEVLRVKRLQRYSSNGVWNLWQLGTRFDWFRGGSRRDKKKNGSSMMQNNLRCAPPMQQSIVV